MSMPAAPLSVRLRHIAAHPVARRLASGGMANLLGKIWVLLVQLAAIPLMTIYWGAEGYGLWLMVSTIPTYIALSDIGLGTAAGVEMTRRVASSDHPGALNAFQSVWVFLTVVIVLIALAVAGWGAVMAFTPGTGEGAITPGQLGIAIMAMAAYAAMAAQMKILNVVYRATHKYALGTLLLDALSPIEGIVMVAVIWGGGGLAEFCVALLVLRIPAWLAYYLIIRRLEPWFELGWKHASRATLRHLLNPSLAAFALTCANALLLQGMVLTLGWVAGAAIVAVFGAARFLTRIPLQLSGLVTRASIPELTRSQTADDAMLTRRILLANVLSSLLATLPFAIAFMAFGPQILAFISQGELSTNHIIFVLLACAATLNACWAALSSPLVAVNRHAAFSYWYLVIAALALLAPLLPIQDRLLAASAAMALAELATTGIVIWLLLKQAWFPVTSGEKAGR